MRIILSEPRRYQGRPITRVWKLFGTQLQLKTLVGTGPDESVLVQAARRQPNPQVIVSQHFHAIVATIGKEISAVRLRTALGIGGQRLHRQDRLPARHVDDTDFSDGCIFTGTKAGKWVCSLSR
jgi:hypothetical protein